MSFPKGKNHSNMVTIWKRFFKPKEMKKKCGNRLPKVMNGSVELQIEP